MWSTGLQSLSRHSQYENSALQYTRMWLPETFVYVHSQSRQNGSHFQEMKSLPEGVYSRDIP